jgi:hypothetical protein
MVEDVRYFEWMTDFERQVAEAAIAADPAPGVKLKENVLAKLPNADQERVDQMINALVNRGVLICTNTIPPPGAPGFDKTSFLKSVASGSPPPTYFKYEKGMKWNNAQ